LERPNLAADSCLIAAPSSALAEPNGGKQAMVNGKLGNPPIISRIAVL
jgi:hypothetical protein